MDATDLYRRALSLWGVDAQARQAQEECAELIAAINRLSRDRDGAAVEVIGEIADVEIMCAQLRLIVGSDLVERMKAGKLARLRERIEDAEHNAAPSAREGGNDG